MKDFLQVKNIHGAVYFINRAHIVYVRPDDGQSYKKSGALIVLHTGEETETLRVKAGEETNAVLAYLGYSPEA